MANLDMGPKTNTEVIEGDKGTYECKVSIVLLYGEWQ